MVTQQRAARVRARTPFPGVFNVGDGDTAFNTSAKVAAIIEANTGNAQFTLIWQRTIPAQQAVAFGSGLAAQQLNQGFMHFFALDVATGFEDGILRLRVANFAQTRTQVIGAFNTQRLHTDDPTTAITATPRDVNTMIPLPLTAESRKYAAGQDDLVQLLFRSTIVTTTVDACEFSIPQTTWE